MKTVRFYGPPLLLLRWRGVMMEECRREATGVVRVYHPFPPDEFYIEVGLARADRQYLNFIWYNQDPRAGGRKWAHVLWAEKMK